MAGLVLRLGFSKYCAKVHVCPVYKCSFSSRITDLFDLKPIGRQTSIKGWVKAIRKMKDNVFVDVSDGSCPYKLQVLVNKSMVPPNLTYGSAVEATGFLATTSKGQLELTTNELVVIGPCVVTDNFPFVPRQTYPPEYLRQFLHLRPRSNEFASLLRVRDAATQAFNDHLRSKGFISVNAPILTSNDCEGAGEVFLVKPDNEDLIKSMAKDSVSNEEAYFDSKAFLTVSGQMHLETIVRALSKVYTFGPTFRAENSKSRLHLAEFYMLEAEVAFANKLEDILTIMETMIKNVTQSLLDECEEDIAVIHKSNNMNLKLSQLTHRKYGIMSYDDAINILVQHASQISTPIKYGIGLGKEHELFLVNHNDGVPIFVVDWPCSIKPFYMKNVHNDPLKVSAVDLLAPAVGELCGGSLREDDYSILESRLINMGLTKSLDWYLELRKFGNCPTAGFGMGFERYLQLLLGIPNIKDTIPFPRWPHNCTL